MTIREYVSRTLQEPLKKYHTPIQDAIIELMIEYFERHYTRIVDLPSITVPSSSRMDILDVIATSYGFTIQEGSSLEEQVQILANIAYVYRLRGSIYSIEHMKTLYGGDLPSPVHVEIPSYNLFKYSISLYDVSDLYQDGQYNRTGTYYVWLYQYLRDIDVLLEWMYKELVNSGVLIHIMNKVLSPDETLSLISDNVVSPVDISAQTLYDASKYISVTDTDDHLVALKSVDEYRYIRRPPSDYAARILKYNNPSETGLLYYIEKADLDGSLDYAFSGSLTEEPEEWIELDESSIVDPTDDVLWVRMMIGEYSKITPVILQDVGVDWYIQYALEDDVLIDWVIWTSQQASNPNALIFTNDPSEALGIYIRADLVSDAYPLCTYQSVALHTGVSGTGEILRSSYYSTTGVDEYGSTGVQILEKATSPVKRSKSMTDVIEMIILTEED